MKNGMCYLKSYLIAITALFAQFMSADTFAGDYSTPTLPMPGRVNTQVNLERQEVLLQRTHKISPDAGNEKSQLCQGCHGEFGNSTDPNIPKLAGQYANYIIKQVRNFQIGQRSNEIMSAMATTISDDDLIDAAAYYASQQTMKSENSRNNQLGETLFLNSEISDLGLACINCHGEKGKGLEPKISAFPIIGGQNKDYLVNQLTNFRDRIRINTPANIMNRITDSLTDAEIKAVAEYISAQ